MKMKNVMYIGILIISLILIGNVICQDETIDYGKELGFGEGKIIGKGMGVIKKHNERGLGFTDSDAIVNIDGNNFGNIDSENENPSIISFDSDGSIKLLDISVNDKGGIYTINGVKFSAPQNSRVIFENGTLVISLAKGSVLDEGLIIEGDSESEIIVDGEEFYYKNNKIKGDMILTRDNEIYINSVSKVSVNGVKINYFGEGDFRLYFDSQEHNDLEYASFGENNLYVNSDMSEIEILFKKDNIYGKVDKGDFFGIVLTGGSDFSINNRDESGYIPEVIFSGENFAIIEDSMNFVSKNGIIEMNKILIEKFDLELAGTDYGADENIFATTSPVEFYFKDSDGNPSFGAIVGESGRDSLNGYKLIIDNANRFKVVRAEVKESYANLEGANVLFSARLTYNYVKLGDLELKNKIVFGENVPKGHKDLVLSRSKDYWTFLSEKVKESIEKLFFLESKKFRELYESKSNEPVERGGSYTQAFSSMFKGEAYFNIDDYDNIAFNHEAGHIYHYDYIKGLIDSDEHLSKLYQDVLNSGDEKLHDEFLVGLHKDWMEISGPYDKVDSENLVYFDAVEGEDPDIPKYGYINPYSGTNLFEDIASHLEASNDEEKLTEIFSGDYNEIHYQKYNWLYRKGFLTDDTFGNIRKIYYENRGEINVKE